MPKKSLSYQFISSLKSPDSRTDYYDTKSGLLLRHYKSGSKTFFYRYRMGGKERMLKIGSYPDVSLGQARNILATDIKPQISKGIDPWAERKARKNKPEAKTFDDLAKVFTQRYIPNNLKESTQRTYKNRIETELQPAFKGMQLKHITQTVIFEFLEEIAVDRGQPTHSNRVRGILSSMFSYAVQRGWLKFNVVQAISPLGKEVQRERKFTPDEIKNLWEGFEKTGRPNGTILKILLLLGQRKGETCRMKWEDIKGDIWTIPRDQTKSGREHTVPLPPMALNIIGDMKNDSPYVFQSTRHPGKPVIYVYGALKRVAESYRMANVHVHDLRHIAATYMARAGTDSTVIGKVLNHKTIAGDHTVTSRYINYDYVKEKRLALSRWAGRLSDIIEDNQAEIPIHKIG